MLWIKTRFGCKLKSNVDSGSTISSHISKLLCTLCYAYISPRSCSSKVSWASGFRRSLFVVSIQLQEEMWEQGVPAADKDVRIHMWDQCFKWKEVLLGVIAKTWTSVLSDSTTCSTNLTLSNVYLLYNGWRNDERNWTSCGEK